jgi:dipeptidase
MKHAIKITLLGLVLGAVAGYGSQQNCYSVVAGKLATADGSVMLAHNEDNGMQHAARMSKVRRRVHGPGEWFELEGGGGIPQVDTTFAYWFLEMPGLGYSHALLNEHGVAVVSDNCPSREDRLDLTDGGIGPALRILVAERCRTSREGAKLVGSLVEKFGYKDSGRTLIICDSREGWLVAMVRGRHWVAARVPDNQVAVIANSYTIREVDLADTLNFLGSADLVSYATERDWHDPSVERKFDFERTYAQRGRRVSPNQTCRQWSGYHHLAPDSFPSPENGDPLPFSAGPAGPVNAGDLFRILRDHYEDTDYEVVADCPHMPARPLKAAVICNGSTNSGSVFVLRSDMPVEIGALWWLALYRPCTSPFLPLYLGLSETPGQLYYEADSEIFMEPGSIGQPDRDRAFRVFRELALLVDMEYPDRIPVVRQAWAEFDNNSVVIHQAFEREVRSKWGVNRRFFMELAERVCQGTVSRAMQQARQIMADY